MNNDFVVPNFLKKDKTSSVKAINLINEKRIDDFVNDEDGRKREEETMDRDADYSFDEEEEYYICNEDDTIKEPECTSGSVSKAQLESVARVARAFRPEEIEVVLDNIPINYIFDKIGKELEKNRRFSEAILNATDIIK